MLSVFLLLVSTAYIFTFLTNPSAAPGPLK